MIPLAAPLDATGVVLLAAFLLVLLCPPLVAYEPLWEVAASLGYAAVAATVLTFRVVPRRSHLTPYRFSLHRIAGNLALALVLAHVLTMVAGDPFMLDYLGWMMPLHVLAGVLAALAFVLAVTSREPALPRRLRLGARSRTFHAWSGIAASTLTTWHVLASSSKLLDSWRYGLLALVFLALPAPALSDRLGGFRERRPAPAASEPFSRAGARGMLRISALIGAIAVLLATAPHVVRLLRG
ncbi:hypothetical protein [Benzoatithermus flavus]|uniref:Ferric reductase like transmembrane component n=1 Tax=Benzoatithermus flavus TaxID=3108223 RepID=A0ABU8XQZ9_9PROT